LSKQRAIASEVELRQTARELLDRQGIVRWRWVRFEPKRGPGADAVVELTLDERKVVFDVAFKLTPTARDLEALANQSGSRPRLLIAPSLSEVLVGHCRQRGINCADLNGRLWVNAAGVFIDRQSSEGPRYQPKLPPPDLFQPKSSRLARALLAQPERRWTAQELTERTGLSQALVYRLIAHLVREAVLVREGQELRLNQFDVLLDQWVRKDDWRKRTTIRQYSLLTSDLEEIARRLATALPASGQLAFTQWFAANLRHPYTTPPVVSAYVSSWLDEAAEKELRARRVVDGGVLWLIVPKDEGVFRETQRVGEFVLACDVQIYLDLLQVGFRGPDQAQALRDWPGFWKTR